MKIICKVCKKEFEPSQDMLKESYLGAMKTQTYFNCPHCNKRYLVCINTPKARRLMMDIKKYEALGDNMKVVELKKKLKVEMDKTNGRST
ncbi:hypothetical protein [Clostridium culturomicium]|uniref:hypothetical protein n=1 Tax=Clostridium culturomicium TaxID=1499683 RepID=UPI00385762A6